MTTETTSQANPSVTIGFFARERFSWAPRALKTLLDNTKDIDFELLIVDSLTPKRYLAEMEAIVAGRENVQFLRADRHLMPNESRNLIAEACTTEYVAMIENDVIVTPGWLKRLIDASKAFDAEVAVPLIRDKSGDYHADGQTGPLVFTETPDGTKLSFGGLDGETGKVPAQLVEVAECHCMLFRTDIIRQAKPFDDFITARDFIDISLELRHAGVRMVFEPKSDVTVNSPPPVEPDEMEFFTARWEWNRALASHERIREKWNLYSIPSSLPFVKERFWRASGWRWPFYYMLRVWPRRVFVLYLPKPVRRSLARVRDKFFGKAEMFAYPNPGERQRRRA